MTTEELKAEVRYVIGACMRKSAYRGEDHVRKVAIECMTKRRGLRLFYYRCEFCSLFHLTKDATTGATPVSYDAAPLTHRIKIA